LQVRNMSASAKGTAQAPGRNVRAKAGLNRAILDQGWRGFRIMLGYKLADRGGRLIEVPTAIPARHARLAASSTPAAAAIKRTSLSSRATIPPMPTQTRRSTFYGAGTPR
jgi:putative transposase